MPTGSDEYFKTVGLESHHFKNLNSQELRKMIWLGSPIYFSG
jgi:hypothetical protein